LCYRRAPRSLEWCPVLLPDAMPVFVPEPMLNDVTPAAPGDGETNGELFAMLLGVPKDGVLPTIKQQV